jgi:hypothetical protein
VGFRGRGKDANLFFACWVVGSEFFLPTYLLLIHLGGGGGGGHWRQNNDLKVSSYSEFVMELIGSIFQNEKARACWRLPL